MQDYRVELDNYSGPMDLLLYLVRKHEIDLYDIPIAKLTDQYLAHVQQLQKIDIELAGEFLVMAATLLEIKSQMLVPRPEGSEQADTAAETPEGGTSSLDPRLELVQQLLAYKRFKDASSELEARMFEWEQRFACSPLTAKPAGEAGDDESAAARDWELEDLGVNDLAEAFERILATIGSVMPRHDVVYDDTPLALHAQDILDRLQRDETSDHHALALSEVFRGRSRSEAVGLFLALLELVRQRQVKVEILREEVTGQPTDIRLELLDPQAAPEPDQPGPDAAERWRDPETGELQLDWPDEALRLRAEKRAHLRALWQAKKASGSASPMDEEAFMRQLDEQEENGA
ncbi:MAG: segregation/condensation protein A [Phycisphaeraceae bacterium]|nr:segregation/condensation protein A [Phycisphaeraceae bacterium]